MAFAFTDFAFLSGRGDSNARPLRPERSALPTALHPEKLMQSYNKHMRTANNNSHY